MEDAKIQLTCKIDKVLNYAMIYNGFPIIHDICIKNTSDIDLQNLTLNIATDNGMIKPFIQGIELIKSEEEIHFNELEVQIDAQYLSALTEKDICQLTISVKQADETLVSDTKKLTALAFDQWPGVLVNPELLASFVMPNHPVVNSMIQLASQYLDKWTKDPSLAGYQYGDPNRVKNMAAAAYAAIQQKNITYAEPPSSFESSGQRIRLADAVLDQNLGTCMDMTLLYVACLEQMGLNPVMILMNGHIFAGVWLIDESFSDIITPDPSQIEKRMSKGIHEMTVVECTAMCAGNHSSFDEAVAKAENNVANYGNFAFAIDVKRARSMGIHPLPIRVKTAEGFKVEHEDRKKKDITGQSKKEVEIFDLPDSFTKDQLTKRSNWERKLLDLSLRNLLINMRMTKSIVPLLASDVSILEDALSDGEEFQVMPRPTEMGLPKDGVYIEMLSNLGTFEDYINLESKHHRLHSLYNEKELNSSLTKIYRSAKTSMEENGASTLYLALGLLRWFEGKSEVPRYAPVVMIPIEIVRKSAKKGYAMHMRDEDAQINITLLEFLKQNYDIHINGLTPPPEDEHGLDIPRIFAIIRKAVMSLSMWDVVEVGLIGNFSFSQFVMWNDIHNNHKFLENSKIVTSLMNGAVQWDCAIPKNIDKQSAYLPVAVDASQLRAINMAAEGVSFVLHGPPGTGKSQTITAMIANALTKGKTILFVAEKMAALEVVQKRLASLGIGDFCLELHSNKATKKAVLDQLKHGLELDQIGERTEYQSKIEDIRKIRSELDAYAQALHKRRSFGKSVRELMDIYETIPEQNVMISFDHNDVKRLTESELDHQKYALERLIAAGNGIGHPHDHPLSSIHSTAYSQQMKFQLQQDIIEYQKSLKELKNITDEFVKETGLDMPVTEKQWKDLYEQVKNVLELEKVPEFLRTSQNIEKDFSDPEIYLMKKQQFDLKKSDFLDNWNENFLQMDMSLYQQKFEKASTKFFGKGRALSALTSELQAFATFSVETDRIPVYLSDIIFYQKEEKELNEMMQSLSYDWKQLLEQYQTIEELQAFKSCTKEQLQSVGSVLKDRIDLTKGNAQDLITIFDQMQLQQKKVVDLLDLRFEDENENWIDQRQKVCTNILENVESIKDWITYLKCDKECREKGLASVCDTYKNGIPNDQLLVIYLRSIYQAIILSVIENDPVLNGFTGISFNEKIMQFKKMDEEFMELTRHEMVYQLTSKLPSSQDSVEINKELNILRRAISSNGRGISIRSLFEQIPEVLTKLCPCMLMSPISAAQYLQAENDLFDIVIFDEASQLPTCKAVGVLARAKNAVIVGDPNQMPPTSFFAGNMVDEDNLDIEDLDSILDDCLALGMPSAYLRWHYRSRHESLIAFSNQEFYENSMLTFPSVNDRERRVRMRKIDGFFDRGKTRVNVNEAKAIVEEIKRRYQDPELRKQSIGVVTFNISQQTLIEDMLQEEYQKDVKFDQWANMGEESLFVKNLENVQGDERDIILFSVAFGPNAEGKMSLNFGPLNKNGGWKRLNVAVSRARSEMVVFTSMTADMINLKRTKAKGVEALRDFLEFAQKGQLQSKNIEKNMEERQGIMEHICQMLNEHGYKYQRSVGHSKFKIDIAVMNPYKEEEYLLGIMLDGESYRQSSNTKDREVAQISVLKGLGWDIYRIWTLDWWDNKEKELKKLIDCLDYKKDAAYDVCAKGEVSTEETEFIKESECIEDAQKIKDIPVQEPKITKHFAEQDHVIKSNMNLTKPNQDVESLYHKESYISADLIMTDISTDEYVQSKNKKMITEKIQQIIDTEAPVSYDTLVKKTLRSFNIARSSPKTLEATQKALKIANTQMNKQQGVKFYWRKDQDPSAYYSFREDKNANTRRSANDICQQELKNAVCMTLLEKGRMKKEDLIKATIRTMGYARSSNVLISAVERGLKYGRKTGEIVEAGEKNVFAVSKYI